MSRPVGPVEAAVAADLQTLPDAQRFGALAASALHLARVQDTTTSARDVASIARELRATLAQLVGTGTEQQTGGDGVDELLDRRRRRGGADAAGAVDPAVGSD